MGVGLFGKIPQKGDFITIGMPQEILKPLDTWLAAGLEGSRTALGPDWLGHYLVAPIWRFRVGSAVLGRPCRGGIMPSVDAVGRYFPLLLVGWPESGAEAPSEANQWYETIESRILSVLAQDNATYLARLLEGIPTPPEISDDTLNPTRSAWWHNELEVHAFDGLPPPPFFTTMLRG